MDEATLKECEKIAGMFGLDRSDIVRLVLQAGIKAITAANYEIGMEIRFGVLPPNAPRDIHRDPPDVSSKIPALPQAGRAGAGRANKTLKSN